MVYHNKVVDGKHTRNEVVKKGMRFLGYYKNGYAHATFWVGMLGGSPNAHLHGIINSLDGSISGNNISYIYPDMETAFVGRFENRVMKKAKYKRVLELKCDTNGLPYVSKFSEGPSDIFYHAPLSNISFGAVPDRVVDPFERNMVELRMSSIPNSGQGVFVKKDVEPSMVVSLYVGYVYDANQMEIYRKHCAFNVSKTYNERRHCSKYAIDINYTNHMINIPPEIDIPETFLPTLGPKV